MLKRWEKIISTSDSQWYKATICEKESTTRGTVYDYDIHEEYNDGSKGNSLMSGWHDTLQGAKRAIDKEYDIVPDIKTKWVQIKNLIL